MRRGYTLNQIGIKDISYPDWPDWYIESMEKLKGHCLYCGKKLIDKRRKYCSPKDENEFPTHKDNCWCATNDLRVTPVRRMVHRIFKFECQECGKHFSYKTPAGAELPIHGGENHHVIPLKDGGKDSIENMTLLCKDCHKKETFKKPKERLLE